MLDVSVDWRMAEVQRLASRLSSKRLHQSLSVAVNGAARSVRSKSASLIAKESGLRKKDVTPALMIRPYSKPSTLSATVRGSGAPLPLIRFKAKQQKKGVKASAWGNAKLYPGTFIATMKSGHTGVFARTSRKRLPIKELWGPGIAKTMADDAVSRVLEDYGRERLLANVSRQLDRYTRRAA